MTSLVQTESSGCNMENSSKKRCSRRERNAQMRLPFWLFALYAFTAITFVCTSNHNCLGCMPSLYHTLVVPARKSLVYNREILTISQKHRKITKNPISYRPCVQQQFQTHHNAICWNKKKKFPKVNYKQNEALPLYRVIQKSTFSLWVKDTIKGEPFPDLNSL